MNEYNNLSELFFESLRVFGEKFMETIPGIVGVILVILLGWLFARLVSLLIERLLKTVKFDSLAEKIKITQFLRAANIKLTPSGIIGRFIYWILILLIIVTAAETMGWTAVSYEISKLLDFLPNLISAILFFIIGTYIASFIRDFIRGATISLGISTGKIISSAIFYLLFVIIALTALKQGGLDTSIITSNLLIIIGTIMVSAGLSYGFASKDVLANILAGFFSKRTFRKGQMIEIDGIRGVIVDISNISMTIQCNDTERVVIPSHQIITSKVKIIRNEKKD